MDPLSITAAVSSLAFNIVKNGRALAVLYEKYHSAQHTIFMIQTECTIMAAAMSQLESSVTGPKATRLATCPHSVLEALDLSLTGCTLTLSALEKEISRLTNDATHANMKVRMFDRTRFLWKEESMVELLQQLRGQSSALTLLLKALDTTSIEQILGIVKTGQPTFKKIRKGADSIRKMYPKEKYAQSILEMPFDDSKTIYSLETVATDAIPASNSNAFSIASSSTRTESSPDVDGLPRGWQKVYSSEHSQWYYFNHANRKSQWEHPLQLPKPPGPPPGPPPVQQPAPNLRTTSDTSLHARQSSSLTSQQAQQGVSSATESLSQLALTSSTETSLPAEIDLTPWLLNTPRKLERALDGYRQEYSAAALAVGIVSLDEPAEFFVRGVRRKEMQVPVTKTDKFPLAHNDTMTFTVLAILVERGILSWEDKLVDLLPTIAPRVHPFHRDTTLGMFTSSKSGIETSLWTAENGDLLRYLSTPDTEAKAGRLAIALFYLVRPPDSTPGGNFVRHPVNALLVALAIEEVTKQPCETLMKSMLFDTLEMYSTGFGWPDMDRNTPANPTQPWPHNGTTKVASFITAGKELNMLSTYPWFGVHCSINDYANFVKLQLQWALGQDPTNTVTSETLTKWHERTSTEDGYYTKGGWYVGQRDWANGPAMMLADSGYGVSNSIWIAPNTRRAYMAMTNIDTGSVGQKVVDEAVFAAYRYDRDRGARSSLG